MHSKPLLPTTPTHYDLCIDPDIEAGTFHGIVTIDVDVTESISSIELHSEGLDITRTFIQDEACTAIPIAGVLRDVAAQKLIFMLCNSIPGNKKLQICLEYSAQMSTTGEAFHKTEVLGAKHIVSTFMESKYARRVFPCFDEPAYKATFSVSLEVDKRLTCIGNMPIKDEIYPHTSSKKTVVFECTPPMSTYLVAFAVGEFDYIETDLCERPLRAYMPKDHDANCVYALGRAACALSFFQELFDRRYPLPKLDIVLIPDIEDGMENWGLITLPAAKCSIDTSSTASDKSAVASMLFHEVAHQWIGNLVTIRSWDELWLHEGLAEWASIYARVKLDGNSDPCHEFLAVDYERALTVDSYRKSHPLGRQVGDAASYDDITYYKACAIFRMIFHLVGEKAFIRAIRHYLAQNAYKNITSENFWMSFNKISGVDVGAQMRAWTKTSGYPLITVVENPSSATVAISQKRFLLLCPDSKAEDRTLYPISLHVRTLRNRMLTSNQSFYSQSKTIKMPSDGLYKINAHSIGFFRVTYPPSYLSRIAQAHDADLLSIPDKISLINDTTSLLFSSSHQQQLTSTRTSHLLALMHSFASTSPPYHLYSAILSTLSKLTNSIPSSNHNQVLKISLQLLHLSLTKASLYEKGLPVPADSLADQRLKALLFSHAADLCERSVIEACIWMFKRYVWGGEEGKQVVNPNIRMTVLRIGVISGGGKAFKALVSELPSSTPSIKRDIIQALGHTRSVRCMKILLDVASRYASQDSEAVLGMLEGLAGSSKGLKVLWEMLKQRVRMQRKGEPKDKEKTKQVVESENTSTREQHIKAALDSRAVRDTAAVLGIVLNAFTREKEVEEVKKFFERWNAETYEDVLEAGLAKIEAKMRWLDKDREDMEQWLQAQSFMSRK